MTTESEKSKDGRAEDQGPIASVTALPGYPSRIVSSSPEAGFYAPAQNEWIWETDANLNIIFVSEAFFIALDLDAKTIIGANFKHVFGSAIQKYNKWEMLYANLLAHQSISDFEIRPKDFTGNVRHIQMSAEPVLTDSGNFVGYRGRLVDVTSIRHEERLLMRSRDRYQLLVENACDLVFEADNELRITYAWGNFLSSRRKDPDSIIGEDLFDALGVCEPVLNFKFKTQVRRELFVPGAIVEDGLWCLQNDSTGFHYYAVYINPTLDAFGNFDGFSGLIRDITENVETMHRLETSEAVFRGLIEESVDPIYLRRGDELVVVNRALCDLLGYKDPETLVRTRKFSELIVGEDREIFLQYLGDEKNSINVPKIQRLRFLHADGSEIPSEVSGRYLDWEGERTRQGSIKDLSQIIATENALKRSQARFKNFTDTAADWYWETDQAGRFTYLSDRLYSVVGFQGDAWLGKTRSQMLQEIQASDHVNEPGSVSSLDETIENRKSFRDFEYSLPNADGREVRVQISGTPYFENGIFGGYRGTGRDVTDSFLLRQRIEYDATHDSLTGLINRREYKRQLEQAIRDYDESRTTLICFVDLDRFKTINDVAGHASGDIALVDIANLIERAAGHDSAVSRFGGDEFALIVKADHFEAASNVLNQILDAINTYKLTHADVVFTVGASIGVVSLESVNKDDVNDVEYLMRHADEACYYAKNIGKNRIHYHGSTSEEDESTVDSRLSSEISLIFGDANPVLCAEPIKSWNASTESTIMLEVSAKGYFDGGTSCEDTVTAAANRYGLLHSLEHWIIGQSLSVWGDTFIADVRERAPVLNINVSALNIEQYRYDELVRTLLENKNIPPHKLCLEIRDTAFIRSSNRFARAVTAIRSLGCLVALDAFGSDRTSLSLLDKLPMDAIKLDSLCADIESGLPSASGLTTLALKYSQHHGAMLIATNVANEAAKQHFRDMGVLCGQGAYGGASRSLVDSLADARAEISTSGGTDVTEAPVSRLREPA